MLNSAIKLATLCQSIGVLVVFTPVVQSLGPESVTEIKTVSQCFRHQSTSSSSIFLTLYCGHRRLIAIRRVVQGSRRQVLDRRGRPADYCGFIDGDCTVEDTDSIDVNEKTANFSSRWKAACDGRQYCIQTVGLPLSSVESRVIPGATEVKCGQLTPVYIMVFYECLWEPVKTLSEPFLTSTSATTVISESDENSIISSLDHVTAEPTVDICANYSSKSFGLTMTSPGFPRYYPENTDCRCIVRAKSQSKVSVMYKDIELTMTDQRDQCVDWLLLQSVGHRNSAAMTCGHLSGADRVIASRGNQMVLHFHTAARSMSATSSNSSSDGYLTTDGQQGGDDEHAAMKGFKIFIQADPQGEFRVNCHLATADAIATSLRVNGNNYGSLTRDKSKASCIIAHPSRSWALVCLSLIFFTYMHSGSHIDDVISTNSS